MADSDHPTLNGVPPNLHCARSWPRSWRRLLARCGPRKHPQHQAQQCHESGTAPRRSGLLQQSELRHSGLCPHEDFAVHNERRHDLVPWAKLVTRSRLIAATGTGCTSADRREGCNQTDCWVPSRSHSSEPVLCRRCDCLNPFCYLSRWEDDGPTRCTRWLWRRRSAHHLVFSPHSATSNRLAVPRYRASCPNPSHCHLGQGCR